MSILLVQDEGFWIELMPDESEDFPDAEEFYTQREVIEQILACDGLSIREMKLSYERPKILTTDEIMEKLAKHKRGE